MKKIEYKISEASQLLLEVIPQARGKYRRNKKEYIGVAVCVVLIVMDYIWGLYFWAWYQLTVACLILIIVSEKEKTYASEKLGHFLYDLSTSLLRERHGCQGIHDVRFETEYDKKADIFHIKNRIESTDVGSKGCNLEGVKTPIILGHDKKLLLVD